jgi:hypothetical protein
MAETGTHTAPGTDERALARHALEEVCSKADPSAAAGVYGRDFLDHVNARDYRGHDGIEKSLALYQLVFRDGDPRIRVEDQVAEGDRVVSRWTAEGRNRGWPLRLWGSPSATSATARSSRIGAPRTTAT